MNRRIELLLRILLLVVVLYTTSFVSFAGNKKKAKRAAANKATVTNTTGAPDLSAPVPGETTNNAANRPALTAPAKKRPKVAIVPAPPPGAIPTYTPPKDQTPPVRRR